MADRSWANNNKSKSNSIRYTESIPTRVETQILEGPIDRPESRVDLILDQVGDVARSGDYLL
jgi:hypothetical protein